MAQKITFILFAVLFQFTIQAQDKTSLDKMYQTSLEKYKAKQYKQANTILDFILEADSAYYEAYLTKVDALSGEKKFKSALLYANKALKLKPNDDDAICKRAFLYFRFGQQQTAKDELGKLLDKNPKSIKALYHWALIENRSKNYKNAIRILTQAKKIESKNLNVLYELGYAYFNTNEDLKAIKLFDKILNTNPRFQAEGIYTMRGACKNRHNNPIGAILDYREALKLNPKNPSLYNNIALIFSKQGKYDKAIKYFDASIQLYKKSGLTYYNRGLSHYWLKQYELSYNDFEKACQLGCKKEDALGYYQSLKRKLKK